MMLDKAKELRKRLRDLERRYERLAETQRLRGRTAEGYARLRTLGQQIDETQKALDNAERG